MNRGLAWAIVAPLIGAVLATLVGPRAARWIAAIATVITVGVIAAVVTAVVTTGPLHHSIGGWGPALGIDLRVDGLAAVMLAMIAVVAALLTVHALTDGDVSARHTRRFFALWCFTWAALDALVLSADVFNLYVTLELVTLAAVGLIALGGEAPALAAALRYLLIALPGSLVYLLGVALLYERYATLDLAQLGARATADVATGVALALITAGLVVKAALFPLHAWLPPAYASARPVVSALLSALIGKTAFYVFARVWLEVYPAALAAVMRPLLGVLGAGAILWCSVLALRQPRLGLVIAYSSVAQVGYLFLGLAIGTPGAVAGAVFVLVAHALAAASMFLATQPITRTLGHDRIAGLTGLSRRVPIAFFALAVAGVSLMGMPPTGGFIGKWLLVRAAIETGQWWWALVMMAGGLIAAGYVFRILRLTFLPPADQAHDPAQNAGGARVALTLAILGLVLGVAPGLALELLGAGGPR